MPKTDDELKEEAATALEDLLARCQDLDNDVQKAYAELNRVYEIVSIFHAVVEAVLDDNALAAPKNAEEEKMRHLVIDARSALEEGCTVSEARLVREEAEME